MEEALTIKKQLKISIPMAFENLVNIFMTLIDTLVIASLGSRALGALGAMGVILSIMQMSIQTIQVSNRTLIAKAFGEKNQSKVKQMTGNAVLLTIGTSVITILIVWWIQSFLPTLFQVDYDSSVAYLSIRLVGFLQTSVVTVLSSYQRVIGKQNRVLVLRILAVMSNLILDVIVVQKGYQIVGVAWVTVIIDTILCFYFVATSFLNYRFQRAYMKELVNLCKWNFVERIASKVDNFIFNLIVARMGSLEYGVHVIAIQIADIYETFTQGFGDGITISVGVALGKNTKQAMQEMKEIAKKLIKISSIIFPMVFLLIAILIMQIAMTEEAAKSIFYKILPLLVLSCYITMSGTYYFSILRGIKEFAFLAKRNMISSVIKIVIAIILAYTPLGIIGVWIAYLSYAITQKYVSKRKYQQLEKQYREEKLEKPEEKCMNMV